MSIFGQVWLWSLAAFVLGALLTWVLLVRPAQARLRELERKLATTRSEPVGGTAGHGPPEQRDHPLDERFDFSAETERRVQPAERERFDPAYQDVEGSDEAWDGSLHPPYEHAADSFGAGEQDDAYTGLFEPAWQEPVDYGAAPEERTRVDAEESIGAALDPGSAPDERDPAGFDHAEPTDTRGLFQPALPTTTGPHHEDPFEPVWTQDVAGREAVLGEQVTESEDEAPTELTEGVRNTAALPKRRPKESPPGGFDPPEPVQPSMRTVTRREPRQDNGTYSGSLFEPSVPAEGAASEPEAMPFATPAGEQAETEGVAVPVGPFGPGSAMPLPGGAKPDEGFEVKASVTTLRYCSPDSPRFDEMVAEVWFRGEADAERVGFRSID